ncbi:MAG TPA: sigma-70 family RNA polymerase sigma factor [Trebonia sp.]|jgi:RNA polymerase sigma factor (sigma-70 family)
MRDSEIVASIVTGDPDGLAAAYDRYADPLYKYCRSLLSEPDAPADAADAVQDTFLIAPSRLTRLSDPGLLRAWLYAVARSECLRILRSGKTAPAAPETQAEADEVIDITEGSAERARLRALLADTARGLNPDERELLELQLRHGLDPGEVAAVLRMSADRVYVLASKAHDQLEACLAVLLVGRSRHGDCDELEAMLDGWDGQLTVPLRRRVYRHIELCSTCHTRLDLELRPAVLLGWPADAAMAAAAMESFRLAPGAPEGLREHTLSLAAAQDSASVAHRAAVVGRAGTFGRDGFPGPQRHLGAIGGLRSLPRARVAAAAGVAVAAVAATATAFALSGGTGSPALAARKPPGASGQATAGGTGQGPTPSATATTPAGRRTTPGTRPPATGRAAPRPAPSASAVVTRAPAPAPQGTVSVSFGGSGPLQPGTPLTLDGTPVTLTAAGGPVNWSVTVSGGPPGHQVSVSGPSSGTLQAGQSVQVMIVANKPDNGATLTVNPGGAAYPLVVNSQNQ